MDHVEAKSVDNALIKRLLTYLYPYRLWVGIAIVMLMIAAAIEAWVPIRIGQLAQEVISQDDPQHFYTILMSCAIVLGWILLNYVLDIFNILIKNQIGQKAIFNLRVQVYEHIQKLPMPFFDHHAIGSLMTRTIQDVDQINQLLSESVIPLIGSAILFIGIFIGIFVINWQMGLFFCLIFPLTWYFVQRFRRKQRQSYRLLRSIISNMNAFLQEHLMGVHIVRHFGLYDTERKKFAQLNQEYLKTSLQATHHYSVFFSGTEFLRNLSMIGAFVLLALFSSFNLQIGTFFTISLYSLMIFRPLLDLAERYNVLQSAMAAAERIFAVLDTPPEYAGAHPGADLTTIESIEFDNVWFAYEAENWILKGLCFKLLKGESMALVGVTGSGKTSVMNLLLGFYPIQKGRILINGQEIDKYSRGALRKQFSIILQDPVIFSGSIYDNIALYDPQINLRQVTDSATYVNLTPVVAKFSDQFEHVLTERGTSLSVGEMQLIALARAVAHQRSVLILDEATSNIDVHTEKIIQETIKKILGRQTALVIAHRLSTIQDVTRILVLHQGVAAESGTHQQLLEKGGIYEKLYRLQFTNEVVNKV
jgi:ATP-binding cassette subfamily B protein